MKRNLLSQMLRNAILLLLFFGWGAGSFVAYGAGADSGIAYGVGNPVIPDEVDIDWEEFSSTNAGQTSGIENLSSISEPHELVAMDRFSTLPGLPQGFKPFVLDRSFEELLFGALHKFKSSPDALSQIIGKVSDLGPSKMPDLLADLKFIDAQGNAIGDDLLEFLLSADDIAVFERRMGAWEVCYIDDVVRTNPDKLAKVSRYLDNNPNAEAAFRVEFNATSVARRGDFVDRTSWADDLKKAHDPSGSAANFTTHGIDVSNVPSNVYNDMVSEASDPQYLPGIINSGSSVPNKVPVTSGYKLYKVVPKGTTSPNQFAPYWIKLDELNTHGAAVNFEQKMGLPVRSHGAKYDVYEIELTSSQANVFESTIANTSEAGYTTTGGAVQSIVLDRGKWSSPKLIQTEELFPPAN